MGILTREPADASAHGTYGVRGRTNPFSRVRARWYLIGALILGVLLLALGWFGNWKSTSDTPAPAEESAEAVRAAEHALEERLAALLARMEGVGKVEVMVTLDASRASLYAQDERTDSSGTNRTHVVVKTQDGETLVLEQEIYPAVRGIAVVCEGGGNDAVQKEIVALLSALFDLGSHHIRVCAAG